jgi:hypothetical protein
MPSTDLDDARFTGIDWADESGGWSRPRGRTVGLVVSLGILAALLAYDYTREHTHPRPVAAVEEWRADRRSRRIAVPVRAVAGD